MNKLFLSSFSENLILLSEWRWHFSTKTLNGCQPVRVISPQVDNFLSSPPIWIKIMIYCIRMKFSVIIQSKNKVSDVSIECDKIDLRFVFINDYIRHE